MASSTTIFSSDQDSDLDSTPYTRMLDTLEVGALDSKTDTQAATMLNEYHQASAKLTDTDKPDKSGEKITPQFEACSKKLYDILSYLVTALTSDKAAINNISIALPSVTNAVMSTFPATNNVRLKAVAGGELLLYTAALLAYTCKKQGKMSADQIQDALKKLGYLCNGFNFTFNMGCKVIATAAGPTLTNTGEIAAALSSLLAGSVILGIVELYAQTRPASSTVSTVSSSIYAGVALGTFATQISRLFNNFPTDPDHPAALELVFRWAPPVISLLGVCAAFFYKNRDRAKPLGTVNILLYDVGSFFETLQVQPDIVAAVLLGTKFIFMGAVWKIECTPNKIPEISLLQQPKEEKEHDITTTSERDNIELQRNDTAVTLSDQHTSPRRLSQFN